MEITATRYTRKDGVHIVLLKTGWLVLCQTFGPMRIWINDENKWDILYKYEKLDEFSYSKDTAMDILKTVKHPKKDFFDTINFGRF